MQRYTVNEQQTCWHLELLTYYHRLDTSGHTGMMMTA